MTVPERFICPHCGKELTAISVELARLQLEQNNLALTIEEISKSVWGEELDRIADRLEGEDD